MSSSTAQRFGAKTYSRTRESAASRAFDEIVSNKPPIKPATAHTKWGKTNFKALRESQRLKGELSQAKKPRLEKEAEGSQDPFSFDPDSERRKSPTKKHGVLAKPGPRLPGTRIATRSSMNEVASGSNDNWSGPVEEVEKDAESPEEGDFTFSPTLSSMKKTYTRTPFANPVETKKKLVAETTESKPLASFGFDEEDEGPKPEASHSTQEGDDDFEESMEDIDDDEVSFNFKMPQFMRKDKKDVSEDDSDESTVKKQPIRTYGTPRLPPVASQQDTSTSSQSSSGSSASMPTAITRGPHSPRRASRYNDPKLLQEYKRMYMEKTSGKNPDAVGALTNSTVVSKAQVKRNKGTTLIVVCKPKGAEKEPKETVHQKYFINRKAVNKSDRAIKISVVAEEPVEEEEEENLEGPEQTEDSSEKTSDFQFDSEDSCSETRIWPTQPITYSSRTQARAHSNSISTVQVRNKIFKSTHLKAASSDPVPSCSQESNASTSSLPSSASSSNTVEDRDTKKPVAVSGKRSYRIFKSRGRPPQEEVKPKEETPEPQQAEPPSLDPEPPTLEPIQMLESSPQASPPYLSAQDDEVEEEVEEETAEEIDDVPMDTALAFSQETDLSSVSKSSANTLTDDFDMDMESDSQSVMSEDSHDSQDDSQGSSSQSLTRKIFKSKNSKNAKRSSDALRRKVLQSPKKSPSKAVYNARSWQGSLDPDSKGDKPVVQEPKKPKPTVSSKSLKSFGFDDEPEVKKAPKLTRSVHWPSRLGDEAYTSLRVNKEHRQLFTVVRNVKQAFEVQESGETQDFMDDVEYLLDGLQDSEPMSIRCLSCIQLAGKCTLPAFRMHLRAHGIMTKIFNLLHDANKNPSLALSTATIMYMLSKDRLNMDLEQESLDLMLRLLEVDSDKNVETQFTEAENKELERTRSRVYELCEQMQCVGTKLDLDTISIGNLAMESLLSLTSRKAGEWFKEELRSQGALDHIVDTVASCSQYVGSDIGSDEKSLSNLKKLDRCLRVLENITYMNTDNQSYVISYKDAQLITSICSVLRACEESMPLYPVIMDPEENKEVKESLGFVIISCVLAILRVLLNVTHDNEFGSTKVGEQDGLMVAVLLCVFSTTQFAPTDQKFDILVLCIGLLINMVEHCLVNRRHLMDSEIILSSGKIASVKALVQLFLEREQAAREIEDQQKDDSDEKEQPSPNKSGEWHESEAGVQWIVKSAEKLRKNNSEPETKPEGNNEEEPSVLDDEETFTKALHKAGKHMENSIIASYVALLIGCLIQDNMMYVERVREFLPTGSFESMIKVLKKFLGFMNLTKAIGNTGGQPIAHVIEILEAC